MTAASRRAWALAVPLALALGAGGCEELGNPTPGAGPSGRGLVEEASTPLGTFVTETRYVPPEQVHTLVTSLGDEVDHVDARVPPGQALVVVMVRVRAHAPLPPIVHLRTRFGFRRHAPVERVWAAHTGRPRYVAFFAVPDIPQHARTLPLGG